MRRIFKWLRSIPRPVAWVVVAGGLLFLMAFAVVFTATAWEYTNSSEFCGTTCHTMPPEYTAYLVSPHARVDCVDCHLGQKSFREAVPAKAKEITHVTNALFNTYDPPIYVKNLRPARETCEHCHNPDKFSFDTFEQFSRFTTDDVNSEDRYYLSFKTGGGKPEQGLGRGIHWHIDSQVSYFTDDPLKQTIPYIKVVAKDGQVTEYFDVEAGLPPDFGTTNADQLRQMDCTDCHNRISHNFRSPDNSMDIALNNGQIDKTIPYIKQKGVEVLRQPYESQEQAHAAMDGLDAWYQENDPEYYAQNQDKIAQAITEIKAMFDITVFPDMSVGWQTHPNNVGHKDFPGCFRCHDGKHVSPQGETVRLECNICHSLPEVVKPGQQAPVVSLGTANEPESHKDSNRLARHRYQFDQTCAECHTINNPGGTDNTSFCSNSACHGTKWVYAGLDAPAISSLVAPPREPGSGQPNAVPHPITADTNCMNCHGLGGVIPAPSSHASFDQSMCTQCHQATLVEPVPAAEAGSTPSAAATPKPAGTGSPPAIPHPLQGRDNCLTCHGEGGIKPYPADHADRPVASCQACHQAGSKPAEATPTTEPTATAQDTTPTPESTEAPAATPTAKPTAPGGAGGPPAIPHELAGREACLACHGEGGLKPVPADHAGRTNDTCQTCHQPGEASPQATDAAGTPAPTQAAAGAAPTIPHPVEGRENQCRTCHATGSIKPFPASHESFTNAQCVTCHQPES